MAEQLAMTWDTPEAVEHVREVLALDRAPAKPKPRRRRSGQAKPPVIQASPSTIVVEPVVIEETLPAAVLLDRRGQPLTPANTPGVRLGRTPANKGKTYPATPPTAAEVWALLSACHTDHADPNHRLAAHRTRALIATLWRTGARISEALALREHDLDLAVGTIRIEQGKGDKPRTVPIDRWLEPELRDWLELRQALPAGDLFCVIKGKTAGYAIDPSDARRVFRELTKRSGVRKRIAPHQLRHAFAIGLLEEGYTMVDISRMLGHADLGVTSVYFSGISTDSIATRIAQDRKAPVMPIPHGASR